MQFLEYYSLIHAIPIEWKRTLRDNEVDTDTPQPTAQKLALLSLQKTAKVCRYIQRKMVEKIFQKPRSEERLNEIISESIDWNYAYLNIFSITLDQRFRYFQYRILHRIIGV